MIRIIVNADDFGWDENRTRAILEAYRRGIVTTTTVMVNMPWFEKAVALAKETDLSPNIGLHLCLTEGMPLTDKIRRSRLFCREDGSFHGRFHVSKLRRLMLPAFERKVVAEEIEAQMHKYIGAGLTMMHLDSHHHSHTDLSIARIALPLARKLGFRTVRLSRNIGGGLSSVKRLYKWYVNRYMGNMLPFNADFFGGFMDLESCWNELPDGARVEVMTHPLFRDRQSGDLSMDGEFVDHRSDIEAIPEFWTKHREDLVLMGAEEGIRR